MRSLIFLLFTLLIFATTGRGQAKNDSAAIREARAAFRIISQKPDSALAIAEKVLLQAQHSGNKRLAAFAYKTRGWAWLHKGFYGKAFPDLLLSAQLFQQLNDTREMMYMYANLGIAYSNRSEFANSARYLFLADSMAQIANDPNIKAEVKRQMGILYREQGQYSKAIPYFRESMEMYRSLHDTVLFNGSAGSLCLAYLAMSMPDSCLAILGEMSLLINALHGVNYEKGMLQERYGDAWFAKANYEKAFESYDNAYRMFAAANNKADMAYEAMNIGKTLTRLKKYRDAENYLLSSYRLNDSLKMINYTADVADQLAILFKTTGNWPKAYRWREIKDSLQDSLHLAAQNEKTAQLQALYEADKKEKEISLLKKDQQLNHAIIQRQNIITQGAVALTVLFLLIGILIVNRYRTIQKARRLIELEKMRNSIARDLHDDMGSALSSINITSKVALEYLRESGFVKNIARFAQTSDVCPSDEPLPAAPVNVLEGHSLSEHLRKIYKNSGLILENMSDIVWTINPVNDTMEKVVFKMREFATDILEPLNIEFSFSQAGNFNEVKLDLQMRRDLYLIFKEAINNAAKYSKCSNVDIMISEKNRQLQLQIKDDGVGFCRNEIKCGNGLKNMEKRAGQINGHLTICSSPENGTIITLIVKSHD